ncbi:hypothetical protein [Nitrobacter sp.]|uniref:hypothetical protein n=1 Tax=Nitrobacter sp. TaxID=29420 RepID=UPI0029CABB0F|nr:hypothetical protein [Nitrobacter sp.]
MTTATMTLAHAKRYDVRQGKRVVAFIVNATIRGESAWRVLPSKPDIAARVPMPVPKHGSPAEALAWFNGVLAE